MDVQSGVGGDIAPGSYHFATAFPRRVLEVSFWRRWLFAVGSGSVLQLLLHDRCPMLTGLCSGWVGLLPHSTFRVPAPRAGGERALTELCAGAAAALFQRHFVTCPLAVSSLLPLTAHAGCCRPRIKAHQNAATSYALPAEWQQYALSVRCSPSNKASLAPLPTVPVGRRQRADARRGGAVREAGGAVSGAQVMGVLQNGRPVCAPLQATSVFAAPSLPVPDCAVVLGCTADLRH